MIGLLTGTLPDRAAIRIRTTQRKSAVFCGLSVRICVKPRSAQRDKSLSHPTRRHLPSNYRIKHLCTPASRTYSQSAVICGLSVRICVKPRSAQRDKNLSRPTRRHLLSNYRIKHLCTPASRTYSQSAVICRLSVRICMKPRSAQRDKPSLLPTSIGLKKLRYRLDSLIEIPQPEVLIR